MCFYAGTLAGLVLSWIKKNMAINRQMVTEMSCFNKWLTESFISNDWLKTADSIEKLQVRPYRPLNYWLTRFVQKRIHSRSCIKLIAHFCSRPRTHVLIYRKVHCLRNEYKNVKIHTWVFLFYCWNYKGILTVWASLRSECFWTLKTCFYVFLKVG